MSKRNNRNKPKMKHIPPDDTHFFASSASTWVTTSPDRDLSQLLELMEAEGRTFNLFMLPVPYTADYEIKRYRPQVDGAMWLGTFTFDEEN